MIYHELHPKNCVQFWGAVQSWVRFIFVVHLANIDILFYIC